MVWTMYLPRPLSSSSRSKDQVKSEKPRSFRPRALASASIGAQVPQISSKFFFELIYLESRVFEYSRVPVMDQCLSPGPGFFFQVNFILQFSKVKTHHTDY